MIYDDVEANFYVARHEPFYITKENIFRRYYTNKCKAC